MFYIPNLPLACYLAIKAKSPVFFSATNPGIHNSGNGMESKYETIQLIPEKFRPKTILVKPNTNFSIVLKSIKKKQIEFPLIAKPDIGFRGLLVKKINSENELKNYLEKYPIEIIIQELISYKNECGVFYHRIPNSTTGTITSITLKKFISVIGDGVSTLNKLVLADKRARIYHAVFTEIHQSNMETIPLKNEKIFLSAIGNHSKGTQFIDGNYLINSNLLSVFDKLNNQIDEWFYGRVDLKYDTIESLEKGEGFKIIEINGIISEPTHVFDTSKNSYFDAVKSIGKHWRIAYNIASHNHLKRGVAYAKPINFLKEMKALKLYVKKMKELSQ